MSYFTNSRSLLGSVGSGTQPFKVLDTREANIYSLRLTVSEQGNGEKTQKGEKGGRRTMGIPFSHKCFNRMTSSVFPLPQLRPPSRQLQTWVLKSKDCVPFTGFSWPHQRLSGQRSRDPSPPMEAGRVQSLFPATQLLEGDFWSLNVQ